MIRKLSRRLGFEIMYEDSRGLFTHRYGGLDFITGRPIHDGMSVAYPNARRVLMKLPR